MSANELLAKYEASFAEARQKFLAIVEGDASDPANRLCQWLATSGENPYGVFSNRSFAGSMGTLEGCVGVFHLIRHAIHDDGDITFVQTKSLGPYICFYWHKEANFEKVFRDEMQGQGHGVSVLKGAKIVGFLDGVDAFIAAKEAHEAAYRKRCEEFERLMGDE